MTDIGDWIWVLVPTAPFIFLGFRQWLKLKERQIDAQSSATAERTAQYAAHTERLEQRVRVLERIVTENGVDLTSQIEDLRSKAVN